MGARFRPLESPPELTAESAAADAAESAAAAGGRYAVAENQPPISTVTAAMAAHPAVPAPAAMASEISQVEMPRWKKAGASSFRPALRSYFHMVRKLSKQAGARAQSAWPVVRSYFDAVGNYCAGVAQSFGNDWRTWMHSDRKAGVTTHKRNLAAKFPVRKSRRKAIRANVVTPITAWLKQPIANEQGVARLPKKHL